MNRINEKEAEYIAISWLQTFCSLGMDVREDFFEFIPKNYMPDESKATDEYGSFGNCFVPDESEKALIAKQFVKVFKMLNKRQLRLAKI